MNKPPSNALWYGIYDARTDQPLAFGTAEEVARQMGYKRVNYLHQMIRKVRNGLCKRYEIYTEPL